MPLAAGYKRGTVVGYGRARTYVHQVKSPMLHQLSYIPRWGGKEQHYAPAIEIPVEALRPEPCFAIGTTPCTPLLTVSLVTSAPE